MFSSLWQPKFCVFRQQLSWWDVDREKKNQVLGDEFAKNLDCYKSHHSKQVAKEKDNLEANKGKMATKTPIGTAFLTKCVYLTLKKAFITK